MAAAVRPARPDRARAAGVPRRALVTQPAAGNDDRVRRMAARRGGDPQLLQGHRSPVLRLGDGARRRGGRRRGRRGAHVAGETATWLGAGAGCVRGRRDGGRADRDPARTALHALVHPGADRSRLARHLPDGAATPGRSRDDARVGRVADRAERVRDDGVARACGRHLPRGGPTRSERQGPAQQRPAANCVSTAT